MLSAWGGVIFQFATAPDRNGTPTVLGAPGAAALAPGNAQAGAPLDHAPLIVPDPLAARDDLPTVYADECHAGQTETKVRRCTYGGSASTPTVVLIGDWHAAQWVPALQSIGERRDWKLVSYTKSSCPYFDVRVADGAEPSDSCVTWNRSVRQAMADDRPDLIVTSTSTTGIPGRGRATRAGEPGRPGGVDASTWLELTSVAPVVVLRAARRPASTSRTAFRVTGPGWPGVRSHASRPWPASACCRSRRPRGRRVCI